MKEALFYKNRAGIVRCRLCARNCVIAEGKTGNCGVRENQGGKLFSLVFGRACSIATDPIEKKPFFHFAPKTQTLSIATVGCNFHCTFCQNAEISQPEKIFGECAEPEALIKINKSQGFSWTYTEPTVFYEYFYETAKLCKKMKKNFYHTWVTNGYTSAEAIKKASKFLNAVNVDYKGDDKFYQELCSARLEPVQNALKAYKKNKIWIEITNLLISGKNDSDEQIEEMVSWITDNIGQVPLHFSRFFPHYKLNAPITPTATLERAAAIAEKELDYVYFGNIHHEKENTFCHNCKNMLIQREGFFVVKIDLKKKGKSYRCPNCNEKIPLAGMDWTRMQTKD
ncbi:MAG: AmmeMemoRadiSam system radical SAM enzyme [Candidatus Aenigmatarchaeota archaeon]